ncbi:MAG TPA: hypothetical protein VF538_13905 [Pyrinomonadaceae bacterium]
MTKLIRAATLMLSISVCAQADGIMQTDKASPAPSPVAAAQSGGEPTESDEPTEAADGTIQTGMTKTAVDISLVLLQSLLTCF